MNLGLAFSEGIHKKSKKSGRIGAMAEVFGDSAIIGRVETDLETLDSSISSWRLLMLSIIMVIVFGLMTARLFKLSVIESERNLALSNGNRVMAKSIHAQRGIIYDRQGRVLVRNIPAFRLFKSASCQATGDLRWGEPKEYCSGYKLISRDEALSLEAKGDAESKRLEVDSLRQYIYKDLLAHVLGYTGELTPGELEILSKPKNYILGDRLGRTGIEEQYEDTLRGVDGKEMYEVDSSGNILRELGKLAPVDGKPVNLSIDIDIQKEAFDALGDNKGMVVISDPRNGEVMAMVSKPSFDPNVFTVEDKDNTASKLFTDEKNTPLVNKAISSLYPPGSTFKLVVASAALETGTITAKTTVIDNGEIVLNGYRFPNWFFKQYGKTEGAVNVVAALKRSNDIFFYKVAGDLGLSNLVLWEKKFGLGEKTGIDLPNENPGLVPDEEWKQKVMREKWYLGDTYHLGIGQGYLLTTPLQVLNWTNVIANNGEIIKLHLARAGEARLAPTKIMTSDNAKIVREGMIEACQENGTAYPLIGFKVGFSEKLKARIDGDNFIDTKDGKVGVTIACKTGTAEYGDPKGKTHAWFTMFAPAYAPEISITVLVESGGEGSTVAAPIAKKVLEGWYK